MKYTLLFFSVFALNTLAEPVDIDHTCLKQAIALNEKLKADVFTDMDNQQSSQVIRLSTESCKQQFTSRESQQVISQSSDETKDNDSDWFTDYILNGDTPDKEGNKRLKRLQKK